MKYFSILSTLVIFQSMLIACETFGEKETIMSIIAITIAMIMGTTLLAEGDRNGETTSLKPIPQPVGGGAGPVVGPGGAGGGAPHY